MCKKFDELTRGCKNDRGSECCGKRSLIFFFVHLIHFRVMAIKYLYDTKSYEPEDKREHRDANDSGHSDKKRTGKHESDESSNG